MSPMLLGILSDSHGRLHHLKAALELLDAHGAQLVLHCGDIGSEDAVRLLASRPAALVWGNTDPADPELRALASDLGIRTAEEPPLVLEVDQLRIAMFHGHEPAFRPVARSIRTQHEPPGHFDWIFFGHTHQQSEWRVGRTRLVNPGALHRATPKTVAMLDTTTNELRFFEVAGI